MRLSFLRRLISPNYKQKCTFHGPKQVNSLSQILVYPVKIIKFCIPTYLTGLIFLKFILIYLFLAALGLRCCARAFSSCGEWGLLFVAVRGFLTAVASLVVEHGL